MNRHPDIAIRQAYVLIVDDEPRSRELLKAILTPGVISFLQLPAAKKHLPWSPESGPI
jgi:hypothetical protein